MIQIYNPDNTDFEKNGDMPLLPSSATVHIVLNGAWEAELQHPIDADGRWKYITEGAVVKMPSINGEQLFRVKKKYKSDSGIEAELDPIFYDAIDDCFLTDVRPTVKSGQDALNIMTAANRKYTGQSNIRKVSTAYYVRKNLIEALNSDDENSFINRWGGEILYDNYKVIVNERAGGDYGVELRYGKNIEKDGLTEEVDIRNVVTRIYPTSYNGYVMSGTGYVDSPLIGNYPVVKTRTIKFENVKMREDASEDDAEKGIVICDTQAELDAALRGMCENQYAAGLDKPSVTISANMVLLKNTELYNDFAVLEDVSIGDTIHCTHDRLEITTDARVVELRYDAIREKVIDVKLGDFQGSYFDRVSSSVSRIDSVIDRNGNVMADRVAGILNGIQTQLRLQSTAAKKVEGRAFMVEDTDPDSALYGCMVWGTQGLQISTQRTADGKDWDWTTAITAKGIVADAILTGIISDRTGTNYWNLDTGEFALTSAAKIQTPDGEMALSDYIKDIAPNTELTHESVFNALTDNGKIQGLYRIGDQIYMNASYIRSGTYVVGGVNNEHGTIQILDAAGNAVGDIDSSGILANNIEVGDSIFIYNRNKQKTVRMGFEEDTDVFWISGSPVSLQSLKSAIATIEEATLNYNTIKNKIWIEKNASLQCDGSATFNGSALFMSAGVQKLLEAGSIESLGDIKTKTGDIYAGNASLKNHTHNGIFNGTRSLVFDNSGSTQHIRTKNNGVVTTEEVYLGSNASKFKAVYAKNGTIQTSDERKKDIVGEFDERYLSVLKHLKPILYRWKDGEDSELHAGFGAQSFENALKECGIKREEMFAVRSEEGEYSLSYAEIVPLLAYGLIELMNKMEGGK